MNILEEIHHVLADPDTSYWARESLLTALQRDPLDAANDAQMVSDLLNLLAEELLQIDEIEILA
jgi:hypothetical protein